MQAGLHSLARYERRNKMKDYWSIGEGYRRTVSTSFVLAHGLLGEYTPKSYLREIGCEYCGTTEKKRVYIRQYWKGGFDRTVARVFCSAACAKKFEAELFEAD